MAFGLNSNRARIVSSMPGDKGLPGLRLGDNALRIARTLPGPWVTGGYANWASLTTAIAGSNNDLVWTAVNGGAAGNNIRIRYVVAGASTPLTVSVSGNDITVNVATDGASAATSTATAIKNAVAASTPASSLVAGANAAGNDGTGVVAALAFTNLTGGTDYVIGRA